MIVYILIRFDFTKMYKFLFPYTVYEASNTTLVHMKQNLIELKVEIDKFTIKV